MPDWLSFRFPLSGLFAACLTCASACVEAPRDARPAADVVISINGYFRDLRAVRATVGTDTLTLLVDTGGGATLITPAAARRLGCRPYGREVGHRMTGEAVEFQRCDSLRVSLAGWTRRLAPIRVFDVNALLPTELPRLDGVLSLDAFRGEIVTVDWPAGRLIVHSATTGPRALEKSGVPVRTSTGPSGAFLTLFARVEGRGGSLWFLIDSGNLRGTLIDSHVYRDSLIATRGDSLAEIRVGARIPTWAPAQRAALIMDGALGTDFLLRGPLTFDLRFSRP